MKLMNMRDTLVTEGTAGLDTIKGVAAYDAFKPRVRQAIGEMVDVLIKYVGDFNAGAQHEQDLHHLIAAFTGIISGIYTKLELTEEDRLRVEAAARAILESRTREQVEEHIRTHHPELISGNKQDLN